MDSVCFEAIAPEGSLRLTLAIHPVSSVGFGDRTRLAAELAKWNLAADGVVLTKYGGGAPHADMALTARRKAAEG